MTGDRVLNYTSAPGVRFAISCSRRNGIDRLFLVGELDQSSVLMLEAELDAMSGAGGALIVDLRELTSIDRWGLHTLERVARRAGSSRLSIVNGHGSVLEAFEAAGIGDVLSGTEVSEFLESGDGEWSPISPPPLPVQAGSRLGIAAVQP